MNKEQVLHRIRGVEIVVDRYALRVPGTSEYDRGRVEVALAIKEELRKVRDAVEDGGGYPDRMSVHALASLLKTMRELQDLSRKAPQSQARRASAARYELRCDQLVRKMLASDDNKDNFITL